MNLQLRHVMCPSIYPKQFQYTSKNSNHHTLVYALIKTPRMIVLVVIGLVVTYIIVYLSFRGGEEG